MASATPDKIDHLPDGSINIQFSDGSALLFQNIEEVKRHAAVINENDYIVRMLAVSDALSASPTLSDIAKIKAIPVRDLPVTKKK